MRFTVRLRKLVLGFLLLCFSLSGLAQMPSTPKAAEDSSMQTKRSWMYSRRYRADFENDYLGNARAADSIAVLLREIGEGRLRSVNVTAYASPDGNTAENLRLSRLRVGNFQAYARERFPEMEGKLTVRDGGEAWDLLRRRIENDRYLSQVRRFKILQILNDPSLTDDARRARLSGDLDEPVYNYLARNHFRYLRGAEIELAYWSEPSFLRARALPRLESVAAPGLHAVEVPQVQTVIIPRGVSSYRIVDDRLPRLGISTNLLYDITWVPGYGLTSIPSVSLEWYPDRGRWTWGVDVEWPMWRHADTHRYFQVNNVTASARRYFKEPKQERFHGWYVLGSVNATRYGIGLGADKGWEGEGLGISAGAGYKWTFGKRLFIDAGVALGIFYSGYDPYVWGDDATLRYYYDYYGDPAEFHKRNQRLTWLGPTRLYLSIGFDFWNRRRAGRTATR